MAEESSIVSFTIEKPRNEVRLLVEARNIAAPSREWAVRFLRNIFEQDQLPQSEYFLLALRNQMYLWRRPTLEPGNPDFEADTASELQRYLSKFKRPLDTLSKDSFEFLIQIWLGDLIDGILPVSGNHQWLTDSGLADSVRDCSLRFNLAA